MADIALTAANVVASTDAVVEAGTAGAAVTAGQWVYIEASTQTYKLADADSATAEVRLPRGMALNGGSAGQPVKIATGGNVVVGGTLAGGTAYYLSKTPGGMAPVADITGTGTYPTILGIAVSTTVLKIAITPSNFSL